MSTTESSGTESRSAPRCNECGARLAHDQRYCLECGARGGPLPTDVSRLIDASHGQRPAGGLRAGVPLTDSLVDTAEPPERLGFEMPGPRAAAAAVIGMLGFGVIVGSLAGGTSIGTLANAPLIVVGVGHSTLSQPNEPATAQTVIATQIEGSSGVAAPAAAPAATSQAPAQASASPTVSPTPTPTPTPAGTSGSAPPAPFGGLPPVKHVFLIVLSDRGFTQSFAANGGYLSGPLRRDGELVQNYYGVAAGPLANEIALISGQGPTEQTASDCPVFLRITSVRKDRGGQVLGSGCAYPPATKTIAGQLTSAGRSWRAYVAGIPSSARTACRVPKAGSMQPQLPGAHTTYLAWRNPFLYFRALTAGNACRQNEVALGQLAKDLRSDTATPSLAYIIPTPCADGSEVPCKAGGQATLAAANRFLKSVVPEIRRSAAYKNAGLIAITFDQAPQTGPYADPSACCGLGSYPNLRSLPADTPAVPPAAMGTPHPTTTAATTTSMTGTTAASTTETTETTDTAPPVSTTPSATTGATTTPAPAASLGAGATTPTGGGGQVGLLLISPFVKPGSIDVVDYFNHFSLLASIENLFGLNHLGYAGAPGLPVIGAGVFNKYAG